MVRMGAFSTELCGGTHLDNTAKAGLFKIISESSVASGVRRIKGTTGLGVLALMAEKDDLLHRTAATLKTPNVSDIATRAMGLQEELRQSKREIEALNGKLAASQVSDLLAGAVKVGQVTLIAKKTEGLALDVVRTLCDELKAKDSTVVVVLSANCDGRLNFVCACGADAVKAGAHAGNLLREISAIAGGKGGGRPDNATSGAKDADKIDDALAAAQTVLSGMLK